MNILKLNTLYIELTHSCNQSCNHCYLDGGLHQEVSEMDTNQVIQILKEFKEQEGSFVIITGGEPLMRKDIFEILDYLDTLDISFTFATNALGINPVKLEQLSTYKNLYCIFTSLLGSNKEEHNNMVNGDSYDKVFETLDFCQTHNIKSYVQITLAKDYMTHIPYITEQLIKYSDCDFKFTPIASLGVKQNQQQYESILVKPEYFDEFTNLISEQQTKYPNRIEESNLNDYEGINHLILDNLKNEFYSLEYGFIAVRPNGDLSFSCNMNNPITFGNATESLKIPVDEKFKNYIKALKEADKLVLEASKNGYLEYDVLLDKHLQNIYNQ